MTETDPPTVTGRSLPRPPRSFEDGDGRTIELRSTDLRTADGPASEPLVEMYDGFDPSDRAQGIPPSKTEYIRTWLEDLLSEGLNVLARHDDAVVGHAVLMPDDGESWELAIFVTQDYQGAGIGTELLETLLGYGAANGVDRVWLTVERWNRPAIALYESVGFETTDSESFEMGMGLRLEAVDD